MIRYLVKCVTPCKIPCGNKIGIWLAWRMDPFIEHTSRKVTYYTGSTQEVLVLRRTLGCKYSKVVTLWRGVSMPLFCNYAFPKGIHNQSNRAQGRWNFTLIQTNHIIICPPVFAKFMRTYLFGYLTVLTYFQSTALYIPQTWPCAPSSSNFSSSNE